MYIIPVYAFVFHTAFHVKHYRKYLQTGQAEYSLFITTRKALKNLTLCLLYPFIILSVISIPTYKIGEH